jgi:hypothetical protein
MLLASSGESVELSLSLEEAIERLLEAVTPLGRRTILGQS